MDNRNVVPLNWCDEQQQQMSEIICHTYKSKQVELMSYQGNNNNKINQETCVPETWLPIPTCRIESFHSTNVSESTKEKLVY